jgi:hypothetical protein
MREGIMDTSFLFDIERKDVFVDGIKVPNKNAIINKDTNEVIGIVGTHYVPLLNKDLLEHCFEILDKSKMLFTVSGGHLIRGGSNTIIEIDILGEEMQAGENDPIGLKVYLINSFDGNSSARLITGFVRLVCENGMTVGKKEFALAYRHVGNVTDLIIRDFRKYITDKRKAMLDFIGKMSKIGFQDVNQIQEIVHASKWIAHKYHKELNEQAAAMKLLNAWELYNVFTYVITHSIAQNMEGRLRLYRRLNEEAEKWNTMSN